MDIKIILAICFYNNQSFIVIIYAHILVFRRELLGWVYRFLKLMVKTNLCLKTNLAINSQSLLLEENVLAALSTVLDF